MFTGTMLMSGGIIIHPKLLLHADGTGASFVDSSQSAHTITAYSNATQSATQSKFGGKSALFASATSDYIDTPMNSDFDFSGGGDFTIDGWFYFNTISVGMGLFNMVTGSGYSPVAITMDGGTNKLMFLASSDDATWNIVAAVEGTTVITTGTWYHIAAVRHGTSYKMYVNGAAEVSVTSSLNPFYPATYKFRCGRHDGAGYFNGYMDEFRVVNGTAMWTANFTPPTAPYSP